MNEDSIPLTSIYSSWDGYNESLISALRPLSPAQLAFRPAANLRSAGEIAAHISIGSIDWFRRMGAPHSHELSERAAAQRLQSLEGSSSALVEWLDASWSMIAATLAAWTIGALTESYLQPFQGKTYSVSRQWTIWRIMAHDIHHGGEMAITLGIQGIALPELGDLGEHITMPPLADAP